MGTSYDLLRAEDVSLADVRKYSLDVLADGELTLLNWRQSPRRWPGRLEGRLTIRR